MIGKMTLSQLAEELDAELLGEDLMFSNISIDTRTLAKGDLYLALVGKNFDGNDFVAEAVAAGASAALVSRKVEAEIATLQVLDSHVALAGIANLNRNRSSAKVVALTGSQGKTTVKEMIGAILNNCGNTLITEANLNNTIGVPLTLLKVQEQHNYVVIEMGANCAGEIAFSVNATQPDVALITNASPSHIEGFGSLRGIVRAKGEIIDGLKSDGVMILNADDAYVNEWALRAESKRKVRFSFDNASADSQYYSSDVVEHADGGSQFTLNTPIGKQKISLGFLGKHNVVNAIAAAAAAIEAGAGLEDVAQGLAGLSPVEGRLSRKMGINGCTVIDDSYNASPRSFFAAIDVLSAFKGVKILVAGDMKELGDDTDTAHRSVGEYASAANISAVWATGEKSKLLVGSYQGESRYFQCKQDLITALRDSMNAETTVLIKGSRGSKMNEVVAALNSSGENQC